MGADTPSCARCELPLAENAPTEPYDGGEAHGALHFPDASMSLQGWEVCLSLLIREVDTLTARVTTLTAALDEGGDAP